MEAASQSYIEHYLFKEFKFNTEEFFQSLGDVDLESTRSSIDKMVEGFNCFQAVLINEEPTTQAVAEKNWI